MSGLPEWVSAELSRRAEEDRINRKAAYDQWAAGYADSGVRVDTQPGTEDKVPDGRISLLPRWAHFLYARSLGDGRTLRIGQPVNVADEGCGIFICPVADGSANAFVWLTGSRELVTLPELKFTLSQGD